MESATASQILDDHVFLVGRPPLDEYLGFVTAQTADADAVDIGVLASDWRAANDHVRELERVEQGCADAPSIGPVGKNLSALVEQVHSDPLFQRSFGIVPTDIGVVELDKVVVYQKFINLAYVRQIQQKLGPNPTEEAVFRLCLPFDHPQPTVNFGRIANNAYMFMSPSTDLRFLEPVLLQFDRIIGHRPQGPVAGVIALLVGFGSNFLNLIHVDNRLVMNNGSHRAYALRDMGITHVPCAIQRVSRREELRVVGSSDLQNNPDNYLKNARPPLLRDYFDPALQKIFKVPRRVRQVKIAFGVEQLDVPASS